MSRSAGRVGLFALLSLVGCTTPHEPSSGGGPDTPVSTEGEDMPVDPAPDASLPPTFQFYTALSDGTQPALDTFAAEALVYLDAAGSGAVPGDYYFDVYALVNTPSGTDSYFAASDRPECRRFHVNPAGQIDLVYAAAPNGIPCEHHQSVDTTNTGALAISVMPFEDITDIVRTDAEGRRTYWARVAPFGESFVGEHGRSIPFFVKGPDALPSVCGDGQLDAAEECDDGNTADNDGCSAVCRVEHLCCCGNGVLEPGEQCDDGNHVDGDGCSSTCQL